MPEFTNAQLERIDEIYSAVYQMCMTVAERDDLEWDISFIGPLADYAAHLLTQRGLRVRFPTHVETDTEDYITDYYGE